MVARLRELSVQMLDLAVELDYFGGFNSSTSQMAAELAGASGVIMNWADVLVSDGGEGLDG